MFFVDFSGDVLIDFHGFQINNFSLKKTRCKSTGFRILIRIHIRCSGYGRPISPNRHGSSGTRLHAVESGDSCCCREDEIGLVNPCSLC